MLKFWVHSTNLKSDRLIYLIVLTSYFILNLAKQAANANPVAESIPTDSVSLADRIAQDEISLSRIINQGNVSSAEKLTAEQRCLLDLESSSKSGKQLLRRFAAVASPTNIQCELKFDNSSTLISSTEQVIVPFKPPINPLLFRDPKPLDRTPISVTNTAPVPTPIKDPRYQIAPRPVNLKQLNPALTRTVVNDVPLTHRTQLEITGGLDSGDRTTTNIGLNATRLDNPTAQESVSANRIYRSEYNSNYSQLRTVRQQRDITTTTITPQKA